jgi:tRNA G18 (ribose-2'-O)-methylase SpoU
MLNIIEINNFNASELDVYARYTEAQLLNKDRPEDGLFIAESPKVIGRALDAGYIPISVLVEKKQMEENEETQEVLARFENTGTSIFTAEFAVLTQLTGFKLTRGMLCTLKRRPLEDFRKLCEGKNRIAILEDVMNPTNVGAIFRSAADAYGCSVTDFRMQQSIVSKSIQSEYGNGVSDSMDIYSG